VVLAALLAGCDSAPQEPQATQVAATVNGEEITVHQLNFELSRIDGIAPDKIREAADQVLRGIVDQQLFMQQAIENKLDRDAGVVRALDAHRRQVLAQKYREQVSEKAPRPSDAEIRQYFEKHPELFSERRIYRLRRLSVQVTPENVEAVKARHAESRTLNDFVQWLQAQRIPARAADTVDPAERIPMEILPRLHALKDGEQLTVQAGNTLNILLITGSQSQPVSEEQARPMVERFLLNARKRELVAGELDRLRAQAKIAYLGDYAAAARAEPARLTSAEPGEEPRGEGSAGSPAALVAPGAGEPARN
jgi:EpsD family peptidyl-prolyl cis-trans isomerase